MDQEAFRTAFEEYVPQGLQRAYDYVDQDNRVETIWIVGDRDGDWATANIVYQLSGVLARPKRVGELLGFDDPQERASAILRPAILQLTGLLLRTGVRAQNPTRVVIRYDVAQQAMNADLRYEPLHMRPDDTLTEVFDAWFERLRTTRDDSASD